jgi:hypothetical protein
LARVNEEWMFKYEESMSQVRAKVDELGSQSNLKQIESLISKIQEKDRSLSELSGGISQMKADVRSS